MPKVNFDASKWARRASASAGDYHAGTASPRRSQSQSAIASKDVYAAGVNAAIASGAYEKGLSKSGDAGWQKGIREKGVGRYSQGVSGAQNEYAAGFRPFVAVIEGIDLGPKGPKGTNYGRVQQIGEALRAAKSSV